MRECWNPSACGRSSPLQYIPVRISRQTRLDANRSRPVRSVSSLMHFAHQVKIYDVRQNQNWSQTHLSVHMISLVQCIWNRDQMARQRWLYRLITSRLECAQFEFGIIHREQIFIEYFSTLLTVLFVIIMYYFVLS
ncbi:Hypothetical_protein [Hexamita inflata]|uniref:Hypothetical_protein n=1 Tax=Hexamita inflata TaxID=28002 RepID=A0AA86Q450_9EUKA|nr:Hypothetical protein HINF_LOCUS39575 [Hexamita inflata]